MSRRRQRALKWSKISLPRTIEKAKKLQNQYLPDVCNWSPRMPLTAMSHVHRFSPGSNAATAPLVLLHGSGGDEHELVPLTDDVAPESPILAVRGGIPFDGGFAFFHRFPDRSIDEADIASRAAILADFIEGARTRYSLSRAPIAIGFSNGAIMVGSRCS